jgi:hypothetical protein
LLLFCFLRVKSIIFQTRICLIRGVFEY